MVQKFFNWYERYYTLNLGIAAALFSLQLIHLYWLSAHVVAHKILGQSYFELSGIWQLLIVIVDYTETPTILLTSLVYLHHLRKGFNARSLWLLFFINSQWLHILWITDEFVIEQIAGRGAIGFPVWLAWIAIFIDYLELPVIFDTARQFLSRV